MLKLIFVAVFAVTVVQGLLFRNDCKTGVDCPSTHCCVNDYMGHYCHPYQNETQPCHLDGHQKLLYHCNCKPGYTCVAIHLSSTDATDDPLHAVDVQLSKAGYGLCKAAHS